MVYINFLAQDTRALGVGSIVRTCLTEIIHVRLVLFTFELVMLPAEINVKGSMTHVFLLWCWE